MSIILDDDAFEDYRKKELQRLSRKQAVLRNRLTNNVLATFRDITTFLDIPGSIALYGVFTGLLILIWLGVQIPLFVVVAILISVITAGVALRILYPPTQE